MEVNIGDPRDLLSLPPPHLSTSLSFAFLSFYFVHTEDTIGFLATDIELFRN